VLAIAVGAVCVRMASAAWLSGRRPVGLRSPARCGTRYARPGSHDVRRRRNRAGRARCRGVRLHTQGAGPDEMVAAVRVVARGEALFGAGIAARMLQHFGRAATSSPFPELTERKTEVLGLLAAGPGQRWGREALGRSAQDGASPSIQHHHHSCTLRRVRSHSFGTRRRVGRSRVGRNYPCHLVPRSSSAIIDDHRR
jgi:hypothetical protein